RIASRAEAPDGAIANRQAYFGSVFALEFILGHTSGGRRCRSSQCRKTGRLDQISSSDAHHSLLSLIPAAPWEAQATPGAASAAPRNRSALPQSECPPVRYGLNRACPLRRPRPVSA